MATFNVPRGWVRKQTGLGDAVAKVTRVLGVKPCAGCERRRRFLNNIINVKPRKAE